MGGKAYSVQRWWSWHVGGMCTGFGGTESSAKFDSEDLKSESIRRVLISALRERKYVGPFDTSVNTCPAPIAL